MGCDIHAFLEVVNPTDNSANFISKIEIERSYCLFAFMANVRNIPERGLKFPVFEPKGMPVKVSKEVQDKLEGEFDDHSHAWLSLEEIEEVQRRYQSDIDLGEQIPNGPSPSLAELITKMRFLKNEGREPRLIFYFDN